MTTEPRYDVVLVGGGLACSLAALSLRRRHPRLRLALVESGSALGGNHTWSFHSTDVDDEAAALLAPLVLRRWPSVEVAFPDHRRVLPIGYATILSSALDTPVRQALSVSGSRLILGRRALEVTATQVLLDDGQRLQADLVLDGRGPSPLPTRPWAEARGYQCFLGQELSVTGDARAFAADRALVMDARIPQQGADGAGFRFMYVLPLAPGRLLVEDTSYRDTALVDRATLRARIASYLDRHGVTVRSVLREEEGILDLPFRDDSVPPLGSPLRLGARGGWLHPTTGYTLPLATRVALSLAEGHLSDAPARLGRLWSASRGPQRFGRTLNRLMFRATDPEERWRLLSRFYRLPESAIARFYSLSSTTLDQARILGGRPPRGLSLRRAFSILQAA